MKKIIKTKKESNAIRNRKDRKKGMEQKTRSMKS